jgi:signal transduction histidine kinase
MKNASVPSALLGVHSSRAGPCLCFEELPLEDGMGNSRNPPPIEEHNLLEGARVATNERLRREREHTDQALREKQAKPERETDETLRRTHREADQMLETAVEEATRQVDSAAVPPAALKYTLERQKVRLERALSDESEPTPEATERKLETAQKALEIASTTAGQVMDAERAKAKETVVEMAARAEETLATEREVVQQLTQHERDERKRAFLDVLTEERQETDEALGLERERSDVLLKGRDEVLAMISHDLRNMLQAMSLKAASLSEAESRKGSERPSAGRQKLAQDIGKACAVMARWAGDLVDISRLDTGKLDFERASCSPEEIVKEATDAFRSVAAEKRTRIHLEIEHIDDRRMLCDRDRIIRVLVNLIDNAIKFTPASGTITVRAEGIRDAVEFSVRDTGPGIADPDRNKIFEQHWHAHTQGAGRGLGLYICKLVVEWHNGSIWVESELGKGSTFFFTLPVE